MRRFFLLICPCLCFQVLPAQQADSSWYRSFTGNIGKYVITMHLHKVSNEYDGYYYYERTRQPIHISGTDTTGTGDSLYLNAYLAGSADMNEIFKLHVCGQNPVGRLAKKGK
jgi:hypothetical protein